MGGVRVRGREEPRGHLFPALLPLPPAPFFLFLLLLRLTMKAGVPTVVSKVNAVASVRLNNTAEPRAPSIAHSHGSPNTGEGGEARGL